jgi:uncharacterized protein involved in outer membrane biogenesis
MGFAIERRLINCENCESKMIRWILKWLFRLVLLVIVLVVVLLLSIDSILRVYIEHKIHAQTGMDAEIGRFSLGFTEPTITILNLKLYNPPSFGGTPFLDIPEIHVEYDPVALAKSDLHITLLRFDLAEVDIVKNQSGQTNLFAIAAAAPLKKSGGHTKKSFTKETGLEFTGIDVLNVSVGKAKFIDLKDQRLNRTMSINLQNVIIKNVKSPADLAGLAALVYLRGGYAIGLPAPPGRPTPKAIRKP